MSSRSGDDRHFRNFEVLHAPAPDPSGGLPPAVLVLGGSTFMGRETVLALLDAGRRVCVVNRGRSYWGTDDVSQGRAARIVADRNDAKAFAARLDEATNRLGTRWALVADFSAYNGADMRASLDGLRGRFETYSYISSDSVYEVSAWAGGGWLPPLGAAGEPIVNEASMDRPGDSAERKRLRKADSYGDGKLEAEEALAAGLAEAPSCRSVSLRLPDVIGPFDDTGRLWAYWHWLRADCESAPPQIHDARASKRPRREGAQPAAADDAPPLAFVFCRDVARFLAHLVAFVPGPGAPRCDAVNVGCERQPSLREFLELLAAVSGQEGPPRLAEVARPRTFLPSVDRPWRLNFARLRADYGFEAEPLEDVLRSCAQWFEKSCSEYPREATRAAMKVPAGAREAALARAGLQAEPSSSSGSDSESS